MTFAFVRPLFLVLLAALPLLWFFPRRNAARARVLLRALVLAALILALAGPVVLRPSGSPHQVLVLDQSASLSPTQRDRAQELFDGWRGRLVDPARSALVLLGPEPDAGPPPPEFRQVLRVSDPLSSSSLGVALALAERQIPAGAPGVVTLISDGLATDRRWGPAVQRLIARGIPVASYDLGREESEFRLVGLEADGLLRVGQTARVTATVAGASSAFTVRLLEADGRELAVSRPIDAAGRVMVPLEFVPRAAGFLAVRAEVRPVVGAGSPASGQVLARTLAVQPSLRLLYLGERMAGGAGKLGELLGNGFTMEDGGGLPLGAGTDLRGYDLVWVDDRPASRLPEEFQRRLTTAVKEDGLGLIVSGGKASFGMGGYDQTPLAEVLPVDLVQRTEKSDPSIALAVIIDTSGSMGGTRIELAKQVARLAIRRLKAHDRVGIVEFYGNKHWALPLQSAANKIAIDRAIGRMQATGGTVMYPAIEEAYYGLKNVNTRYKHILIITDAGVEDADYESLVRLITRDRVNVSTVLVGSQAHSQSLVDLAAWGQGRFYAASDRFALPEVVLKQATTMNLPAYKIGRFPLAGRGGPGWWDAVDRASVPGLAGYVETQVRPGAEVLLEVGGSAHPVLSTWHYGLGRVTALMTEPLGEGTANWQDWDDYGRWLARVVSRTAGDLRPFRFDLERRDQHLAVLARRYGDQAGAIPEAQLLGPAGEPGPPLAFRQVAPGEFRAELVFDPLAEARVIAGTTNDPARVRDSGRQLLVSTATADVAAEGQVDPERALDLAGLAAATGGVFVDASRSAPLAAEPAPAAGRAPLSLLELGPFAALLALLLYLFELFHRRRAVPSLPPVR